MKKRPVFVALDSNNTNFILRTVKNNSIQADAKKSAFTRVGSGNANAFWGYTHILPAQFLDAHGNLCSAIKLTDSLGNYSGEDCVDQSFVTFIWTGFVWKCTCDDEGIFQLDPGAEIRNNS